jgi:hypothetical protein
MTQGAYKKQLNKTHGHTVGGKATRVYETWASMHKRCCNSKCKSYPRYGGRGISVCERWSKFENFLADMGEPPPGKSIDRYPNNDGNYEPGNCRWATREEQEANKKKPSPDGSPIKDIEKSLGISQSVIWHRLDRGWPAEKAWTAPKSMKRGHA